jgi:hypothetical protein
MGLLRRSVASLLGGHWRASCSRTDRVPAEAYRLIQRQSLLNSLRPIGTPCLGLLGAESAIAALRGVGEGIRSEVLSTGSTGERPARPEWLCGATAERLSGSGERLTGTEAAARLALLPSLLALHGQQVSELMDRNADLLGHGTLHCDLLRKLYEHRDDLLYRNVRARMAAKGVLERIVCPRTL